MTKKYNYLFGPVPSRRFGRSLGVDLTPYKTCSLDCVFCQLGPTTDKTITRKEYVQTHDVMSEIEDWLRTDGQANYITLSGSGEPTLHSEFGRVLEFIRKKSSIPAVLLTNGTTMYDPRVREQALCANVVKVSLSAYDDLSFAQINRPHPVLQFEQLVEGQKTFRAQFKGDIWLEVFLVQGMNSIPNDVRKIAAFAKEICPDKIQLNTAVRPPVEDFVAPLSKERMQALSPLFEPKAELIAEFESSRVKEVQINETAILSMLQRRPCTAKQVAATFGLHLNEVAKYIGKLLRSNQISVRYKHSDVYYTAISNTARN